jgi:class 3 adenylate cyclase
MPSAGALRFADVKGTPVPIPGRLGLRDLTYDAVVQAFLGATILFPVAGLLAGFVYAIGRDDFQHPALVLGVAAVALAIGALYMLILRFWLDAALDHAQLIIHIALFVSGLAITGALYGAGPDKFMIGTVVYLQPLIFCCYLLRMPHAFAHIAVLAVGFGLALANSPGISHPVVQWAFLVGIGSSGALVLGRLADSASTMAMSEYAAHKALAEVNDTLELRVAEQVDELERLGRLRRFLSPLVADAVAAGSSELLAPHRRQIAVFFCDLRGFTAFSAGAEPEDVVEVLGDYYSTMGHHLDAHKATFGSFAGDGVMAYFNDPLPVENPAECALALALDVANALDALVHQWDVKGYELNYGIGITYGHATLGVIGYEERSEYTALGSVVNLAARLSDQAAGGEILLDGRAASRIGDSPKVLPAGERVLKGMSHPVAVFEAIRNGA